MLRVLTKWRYRVQAVGRVYKVHTYVLRLLSCEESSWYLRRDISDTSGLFRRERKKPRWLIWTVFSALAEKKITPRHKLCQQCIWRTLLALTRFDWQAISGSAETIIKNSEAPVDMSRRQIGIILQRQQLWWNVFTRKPKLSPTSVVLFVLLLHKMK